MINHGFRTAVLPLQLCGLLVVMVTFTRAQGKQISKANVFCEVCKSIVGHQHDSFFFIFINLFKGATLRDIF